MKENKLYRSLCEDFRTLKDSEHDKFEAKLPDFLKKLQEITIEEMEDISLQFHRILYRNDCDYDHTPPYAVTYREICKKICIRCTREQDVIKIGYIMQYCGYEEWAENMFKEDWTKNIFEN